MVKLIRLKKHPYIFYSMKDFFSEMMENTAGNHQKHTLLIVKSCYLILMVFLLLNCASKPQVNLPLDYTRSFSFSGTRNLPDQWWTEFEDQQLDRLIQSALDSNFNLLTAFHRIKEARAVFRRESASLVPDLEGTARAELSQPQQAFEDFQQNRSLQLGLASFYELDLWGRIRSRIDAQEYQLKATLEDYQAAAISLSAQVVSTWFQLTEAHNQLELANQQIQTNQQVLNSLKRRFGKGLSRAADILRQQQLLKSTREQKLYVQSRKQVLEHQLAILTGTAPQKTLDISLSALPELPPLPETGLPVKLVQRRPDVRSAFFQLQSADRELAAAISNQYPRLSLSLSISTAYNEADNLFVNWAHSIAGNLVAPIFYGGQLRAEVERFEAVKKQLIYQYGQSVLTAFQEVEDALIREVNQVESIALLEEQVELMQKTYQQLQLEYFNGISTYLDVLTALDDLQQLQRNLLSARMDLLQYRIDLYRSLAGGFDQEALADQL